MTMPSRARDPSGADRGQHVDVAIIGGGPAGWAAAIPLSRAGMSVAVIDRGPQRRPVIGEGLPPAAAPLLRDLGVWPAFLADQHLPSYGNVSAWGAPELDETDFVRHPEGVGWRLDRLRFDTLFARAAIHAGAAHWDHTRVRQCERAEQGGWRLDLDDQEQRSAMQARVIIDASGRVRWLSRQQGVCSDRADRLVAIIGLMEPATMSSDHDGRTLIEAVQDGWWSAGLLPTGTLVVAYMTDTDIAAHTQVQTIGGWTNRLMQTRHILDRTTQHGYRLMGHLRIMCARTSCLQVAGGDDWCAVGDAVAAHDPLSSLGIVASLITGQQAAKAILAGQGVLHHDGQALEEYTGCVRHLYAQYLAQWLSYYALEQRWPTRAFWRRRHSLVARIMGDALYP